MADLSTSLASNYLVLTSVGVLICKIFSTQKNPKKLHLFAQNPQIPTFMDMKEIARYVGQICCAVDY